VVLKKTVLLSEITSTTNTRNPVVANNNSRIITYNQLITFNDISVTNKTLDGGTTLDISTLQASYVELPKGIYYYKLNLNVWGSDADTARSIMAGLIRRSPVGMHVGYFGPPNLEYNNWNSYFDNEGFFEITTATSDLGLSIVNGNRGGNALIGGGGYYTMDSATRWSTHPQRTNNSEVFSLTLIRVRK
jgi:hypothetical protein